jgi:GTP-binding protein HflX
MNNLAGDKRMELSVRSERAILVRVLLPESSDDPTAPLDELASLAQTAGAQVVDRVTQQRTTIDPATFIGRGKVLEIARLVKQHQADVVIFDHDLSPNQLRDVERLCDCKILDRSELILDIFATRARTAEAQLQVALAQLEYTYPRLRHMWSHLERIGAGAGAGVGARGPGEMQLEIDRRLVRDKVSDLKKRIAQVQSRKSREVSTRRMTNFTVSLVGYTNAGKSTLFNTLTGSDTFVEDRLFATLDTKTRQWKLGEAHWALVSDTVGFIRDLPHHLVASFKATLEEATHADLLLIVVDASDPQAPMHLKSVKQVLTEIGCGEQNAILVLNKIDAIAQREDLAYWRKRFPHAIELSAREGSGAALLAQSVREHMLGTLWRVQAQLHLADTRGITFLEKFAQIIARDYDRHPNSVVLDMCIGDRILDQAYQHATNLKIIRKIEDNSRLATVTPLKVADLLANHSPATGPVLNTRP